MREAFKSGDAPGPPALRIGQQFMDIIAIVIALVAFAIFFASVELLDRV